MKPWIMRTMRLFFLKSCPTVFQLNLNFSSRFSMPSSSGLGGAAGLVLHEEEDDDGDEGRRSRP